jgi:hypothetical protein
VLLVVAAVAEQQQERVRLVVQAVVVNVKTQAVLVTKVDTLQLKDLVVQVAVIGVVEVVVLLRLVLELVVKD